ncbi:hypothetical protein KOY48_03065 [Candidatus Minimicrobia naudis]|uniref:Uncharacterized protein n=1 Tax=Candidatus Minimicrobia naudis TaxID=2841263 RepID=A0A8F1MAP6_9BACT|nr:hypothetical protein KOY48_03065 [Candidatus Minimicrobia naudis]
MNQKSMKKLKICSHRSGRSFLWCLVIVGLIVVNNNRSSGVSKTAKKKIQKIFAEEDAMSLQKSFPNMAIQFGTTQETFLLAKVTS